MATAKEIPAGDFTELTRASHYFAVADRYLSAWHQYERLAWFYLFCAHVGEDLMVEVTDKERVEAEVRLLQQRTSMQLRPLRSGPYLEEEYRDLN